MEKSEIALELLLKILDDKASTNPHLASSAPNVASKGDSPSGHLDPVKIAQAYNAILRTIHESPPMASK
jgi:hypothetical protein